MVAVRSAVLSFLGAHSLLGVVLWLLVPALSWPYLLGWQIFTVLTAGQGWLLGTRQKPPQVIRRLWLSELIKILIFSCCVLAVLWFGIPLAPLLWGYVAAVCLSPLSWIWAQKR